MKRISLSFIAILVVIYTLVCPVYAASHTFTLTVSPSSKTANLGDTVSFDIGIADIDQSTDGISAVQGMLKFDSDLIESVDITTSSNWSITINKTQGDPEKGKFVIANLGSVKETQVIAKLYAKIRADATVKTGTITLKDVFSSYNDGATEKTTKTITVNINSEGGGSQEDDDQIVPENPEKKEEVTPVSPDSSAEEQKTPAQPVQSQDKSAKTTTASKATALPKAGIVASGIGIAVLAAIIVAIIELVKYKKTGK